MFIALTRWIHTSLQRALAARARLAQRRAWLATIRLLDAMPEHQRKDIGYVREECEKAHLNHVSDPRR